MSVDYNCKVTPMPTTAQIGMELIAHRNLLDEHVQLMQQQATAILALTDQVADLNSRISGLEKLITPLSLNIK